MEQKLLVGSKKMEKAMRQEKKLQRAKIEIQRIKEQEKQQKIE